MQLTMQRTNSLLKKYLPGSSLLTGSDPSAIALDIVETKEEELVTPETVVRENYDPTIDLPKYEYPTLDLLENYGSEKIKIDSEELMRNKDQIVSTLKNYGIEIQSIKATVGPTVTLYEIVPAPGIRISKIKNLEDDIALSLAALGIRIIAPIPGKGTIGIEVPNMHKGNSRHPFAHCFGKIPACSNGPSDCTWQNHLQRDLHCRPREDASPADGRRYRAG
jgi:DNA segregation ATPase FtsK/SpoIIIE-like protein